MGCYRTHVAACAVVLLASLAGAGIRGQKTPVAEQPAFRTATDIIPVDVVVVDHEGAQVADLEAGAFNVTIDGRPRRIASARYIRYAIAPQPALGEGAGRSSRVPAPSRVSTNQEPAGRFVMVVVDEPGMTPGGTRAALEGVTGLLAKLGPGDAVGLAALPSRGVVVPFTRDHARVLETLTRIGGGPDTYMAITDRRVGWAEALDYGRQRDGLAWKATIERECSYCGRDMVCLDQCKGQAESEAIAILGGIRQRVAGFRGGMSDVLSYLRGIDAPVALILLSSGLIADPWDGELDSVSTDAAASRTSIYALHFRMPELPDASERGPSPSRSADLALRRNGLELLAGRTRGSIFDVYGSAAPAFDAIGVELSGYYLLGVEPLPGDRDGKRHRINVEVPRRDVNVRARRELVWKEPFLAGRSPADAVRAMLESPVAASEVPLRVTSYTGPAPEGGKLRVTISVEVGVQSAGSEEVTVGWILSAANRKPSAGAAGKVTLQPFSGRTGGPLAFVQAAIVEAGRYTFKLAVQDSKGRGGSVTHDVDARLRSAGPLAVGDLVIGPPPAGEKREFDAPVECVLEDDRLFVYLPVTSPQAKMLAEARANIEIATGDEERVLLQAPTRLAAVHADQRAVQASISLGLLPPGRYVARVRLSTGDVVAAVASREFLFAPAPAAPDAGRGRSSESGGTPFLGPAFTLGQVLEPRALAPFLDRAEKTAPDIPAAVFTEAREGRLSAAAGALPAGSGGPVPAFLRGLALLQRGDLEAAGQAFRDSRRLSPEFADAAVFLGVCFVAGGRDAEAVGALQTARFGLDSEPMVHHLLIDARLRRRQVDPARSLAEQAVKRWPDDPRFQLQLATALAAAGEAPRALVVLDQYLVSHPDDPDALFLALRLLYESAATGKGKRASGLVERFQRYAALYEAAAGPERALVAEWRKYVTR